jgi:hypothetical protein
MGFWCAGTEAATSDQNASGQGLGVRGRATGSPCRARVRRGPSTGSPVGGHVDCVRIYFSWVRSEAVAAYLGDVADQFIRS